MDPRMQILLAAFNDEMEKLAAGKQLANFRLRGGVKGMRSRRRTAVNLREGYATPKSGSGRVGKDSTTTGYDINPASRSPAERVAGRNPGVSTPRSERASDQGRFAPRMTKDPSGQQVAVYGRG